MKILYQRDITKGDDQEGVAAFWVEHRVTQEVRSFATMLVSGTVSHQGEIDDVIRRCAENWQLERMATVDRNILRLGTFELLFCAEIPPKVAINEAVELAKKYGDVESSKFVNGVLDRIHREGTPRGAADAPAGSDGSPPGTVSEAR